MRLLNRLMPVFRPNSKSGTVERPRHDWKNMDRMCRVYRPEEIAWKLDAKHPYFRMASGGIYAVATLRNRKGEVKPACFIRVDKDRQPRRERKRTRLKARLLAEATA